MSAVRAIVTIGISVLMLLLVGPALFAKPPTAYTGLSIKAFSGGTVTVLVRGGSPAYRAGLRTGDTVSCLSLRDGLYVQGEPPYRATPLHVCVLRNGTWNQLSLRAARIAPASSSYGSTLLSALRLAIYAIFLFVGCTLVLARPSLMTWMLFIYCVGNAPIAAAIGADVGLPSPWYAALWALRSVENSLAPGALALFTLLVPEGHTSTGWRRWTFVSVALVTAAGVTTLTILGQHWSPADPAGASFSMALTAIVVLEVIVRLSTMEPLERARFAWAAFAIIFGVVTNGIRTGAFLALSTSAVAYQVAGYATVVMPLALMYAILRRHVIDVRFVISRGVVFAAITTLVVGLIGIVDWLTSTYLHQARAAMAVDALVTIVVGFLLHRAYGWIESATDFLLFRRKHEAAAYLQRLAKTLPFAEHEEAVDRAVVHDPYEKLDLTAAALFRARGTRYVAEEAAGWRTQDVPTFHRDDDIIRFLLAERTRLFIGDLRSHVTEPLRELGHTPAVAVPIFARNRLSALAIYGIHRDGTQLDPDEVGVLERLCDAAAQAYVSIELSRYEATGATALPAMEPL